MTGTAPHSRWWRIGRMVATAVFFVVIVVLLIMWLAGAFHPKIDSTRAAAGDTSVAPRPVGDATLVPVRKVMVSRTESAVGTVRAVYETSVASKLLAKVLEVNVTAGKPVNVGDVLVRLDEADLVARLGQAEAATDRARAAREQAKTEFDRIRALFEQQSAAKIEVDRMDTAWRAAEADLTRTQQAVTEAQTILGYATITSSIDGIVVDKRVEAGDTVTPGQVLLTLYDPTRMQLVASVRESLTRRLRVGQLIGVHIEALEKTCDGRVSEIVPEADSASRTFAVKVTGPCPPGVYSGMFGRLLIPLDDEALLVIPRSAIRRVGQLDIVDVADRGGLQRRAVKLGRILNGDVQVLSGLREGEQVVLNRGS